MGCCVEELFSVGEGLFSTSCPLICIWICGLTVHYVGVDICMCESPVEVGIISDVHHNIISFYIDGTDYFKK